jgi:uncharacterized protein (DUF2062 family)
MKEVFLRIVNKWLIGPFTKFLKIGLSPEKLAQSFALGICLGTMPVPGSTITCTIAAITLKLNFGAIQLINYMVSPLQLLLIYPLFKAGAALTSSQIMSGTLDSFTERFRLDVWNTLLELGTTAMFAVAVWAVISVPVGIILYKVSLPVFRRISDKNETERTNL